VSSTSAEDVYENYSVKVGKRRRRRRRRRRRC
jgi:hypothetical protein